MSNFNPKAIKRESEAIILKAGGQICDWLPFIDTDLKPRDLNAVIARSLILNAMLQIYFEAPMSIIRDWIARNGLNNELSASERTLLAKVNGKLSKQELANLGWSMEALWALVWAGSLINKLPFDQGVQNSLASLCPNLQRNEDGSKFKKNMRLRSHEELYRMLDLYYRLHWWTRNAQLTNQKTGKVSIDIIMERRKVLEWIMDGSCDWDSVELST